MSAYLRKEPPKGNTKDVQNWFIMDHDSWHSRSSKLNTYTLKMVDIATPVLDKIKFSTTTFSFCNLGNGKSTFNVLWEIRIFRIAYIRMYMQC